MPLAFSLSQYLCYPWRDDSGVSPSERRRTCRRWEDCMGEEEEEEQGAEECVRHFDKRRVQLGLCFQVRGS